MNRVLRNLSILPEHVGHRALQPVAHLLQGLQGHILLPHLQPLQGRIADPHLTRELLIREVAPLLSQERTESLCQALGHLPAILVRRLSHKWDIWPTSCCAFLDNCRQPQPLEGLET